MAAASVPPPGFHSVTPRMVVNDLNGAVTFLRRVFGATGNVEANRPAEVCIGDSLILVSETGQREPFPAFLYVYVEPPLDTPYGDRRAMVRDQSGNVYQIASRQVGPTS